MQAHSGTAPKTSDNKLKSNDMSSEHLSVAPVKLTKPVGAIISGLAVLRYLSQQSEAVPLSRITRELGLNPSTCLNILRTFVHEGYVTFRPQSKLYSLGLGALELLNGAAAQGVKLDAIRSLTDSIAAREMVTVTLWRRIAQDRKMVLLASPAPSDMRIQMEVGTRLPLLVGAAGRLLGAFSSLSERELRAQYQSIRMDNPVSFEEFQAEMAEARARGWALDENRYRDGATSVAVAVVNDSADSVFAITATMFSAQFSADRAERLISLLRQPASLLAKAFPYI